MAHRVSAGKGLLCGRAAAARSGLLRRTAGLSAAVLLATLGASEPHRAIAGARVETGAEITRIRVTNHKSRTIKLSRPFTQAVVGDPKIADVLPMSDTVIYIQGKKIGTTNVSIFDREKRLIAVVDIDVTIDTRYIASSIRKSVSSKGIRVSARNEQVVLTGTAKNAVDAERAVAIAKAMLPKVAVINAMRVAPAQQVMLKVRYLEVDRGAARDIGVNWYGGNRAGTSGVNTGLGNVLQGDRSIRDSSGSVIGPSAALLPLFRVAGTLASGATAQPFGLAIASLNKGARTVDLMVNMLETRGLVRTLAEPDLVALSGDTAEFQAGGEYPVPVTQASASGVPTVTIEWKEYGVKLKFTPTVLNDGIINLQIAPRVSELDYTNAVVSNSYRIPAVKTRETKTTVELRDGQSFAISGLLQDENRRDVSQVPWLGTVPILGVLFRSSSYQKRESDLVVMVTPHLVQPAAPGQELASPLDQRIPSNDIDFFLLGRLDMRKKYNDYVTAGDGIKGPYGHIVPATGR